MITISPSLLACDFMNIQREVNTLEKIPNLWLHLDIMDGHFVPNLTFGPPVISGISKITEIPLDAHLMVTNPEDYIETLSKVGVHNFTFHWEAVIHHDRLLQHLKQYFKSVGVSLNPSTPLSVIPEYLFKQMDLVLLMSVNPGFGGQSFIDPILDKVKELKAIKDKIGAKFEIQVDGGVTDKNAKSLIDAGATNLVAGSYIFNKNANEYENAINNLR